MGYEDIDELGVRQHGLVTTTQLAALGYSPTTLHRMCGAGRVARMHRSVYRLAGAPTTWRQLAMAATLAGGEGTYAAHRTAAALHPLFKTFGGDHRSRVRGHAPPARDRDQEPSDVRPSGRRPVDGRSHSDSLPQPNAHRRGPLLGLQAGQTAPRSRYEGRPHELQGVRGTGARAGETGA
ncbi:MAG: type IV toxin-antitoxin system AbiEi family antitoxin domain-containing protein [Microthrixaceae bacterium]|nr:type IV toxin-antitoxin system AbiEi family antitoxin domain-containing protein [Microthrixaceae bacterium]